MPSWGTQIPSSSTAHPAPAAAAVVLAAKGPAAPFPGELLLADRRHLIWEVTGHCPLLHPRSAHSQWMTNTGIPKAGPPAWGSGVGRGGDCGCVLELRQRQREMVEPEISRHIWSKFEPHPVSKLGLSWLKLLLFSIKILMSYIHLDFWWLGSQFIKFDPGFIQLSELVIKDSEDSANHDIWVKPLWAAVSLKSGNNNPCSLCLIGV